MLPTQKDSSFYFHYLPNAKFNGLLSKDMQDFLYKWGMKDHLSCKKFTFDQLFSPFNIQQFLIDFFNHPQVKAHFQIVGHGDSTCQLGHVTNVDAEPLSLSITSMDFFDRLKSHGIIRQNGDIVKCMDEYVDQFIVSDNFRKCLLMPEFEGYDCFDENDRNEFIFHLMKSLALGGRLCQFEDTMEPYLKMTKLLYKDLISVTKDSTTNEIKISSLVYKIRSVTSTVSPLFPMEHPQNVCYICIDPMKRHVNVFYHASDSYYS